MSIIPINKRRGSTVFDDPRWPSADLWEPFTDFPFPFPSPISNIFREFNPFSSVNFRLNRRETGNAHVCSRSDADCGSFTTRMKLPDDAGIEELNAFMSNVPLNANVTVPKEAAVTGRHDVGVIQIWGFFLYESK
ncbi:17.6 kDa class I heat shock protein [Pyrus ussuriensis x Pyrus communis]|uniref:17.6 kDa class I heat shock protein n=1 Tax=Pyrus ussuriensis x Pyrus communis TaxID=2448454 RepID=A0A5N5G8V8_9ROSA|nr:17.6 kDa class I heat shock protein [Pyrus ussuriensis x Pyrus communis]